LNIRFNPAHRLACFISFPETRFYRQVSPELLTVNRYGVESGMIGPQWVKPIDAMPIMVADIDLQQNKTKKIT
jgi:hypothetical protein